MHEWNSSYIRFWTTEDISVNVVSYYEAIGTLK